MVERPSSLEPTGHILEHKTYHPDFDTQSDLKIQGSILRTICKKVASLTIINRCLAALFHSEELPFFCRNAFSPQLPSSATHLFQRTTIIVHSTLPPLFPAPHTSPSSSKQPALREASVLYRDSPAQTSTSTNLLAGGRGKSSRVCAGRSQIHSFQLFPLPSTPISVTNPLRMVYDQSRISAWPMLQHAPETVLPETEVFSIAVPRLGQWPRWMDDLQRYWGPVQSLLRVETS